MTRTLRHLAATAAVVVMVTIASSCGSSDDSDGAASGAGTETTAADSGTRGGIYGDTGTEAPADTSAAAPATGDGAVAIADFTFDPADVSVAAGTTVTWTNEDGTTHRVAANDESFDSEDLGQGDTFEHTFDTAGTFDYICSIHPQMKGTVTVTG